MTETKKRINALKKRLPGVKARVAATAMSLLLAMAMLTSVSFAWYTLASSPEARGIKTTVAANGNLEVALAGRYDDEGNLLAPPVSGIVDSFAAQGQVAGNLTWGNLINLSGAYGIENLVLRPATLDLGGSNAFLSSKIYGEDGRVEDDLLDFGFTVYDKDAGTKDFIYKANRYYGVRAISSVKYPDGKGELEIKMGQLDAKRQKVMNEYQRIYTNEQYISTIQAIVQTYLDANVDNKLNGVPMSSVDCTGFVPDLYTMMQDFNDKAICAYGDVLAYMATIQTGVEHTRASLRTLDYGGATPDNKADDRTPNDPSDDIALVGLKEYLDLETSVDEALNGKVGTNGNKTKQGLIDYNQIAADGGKVSWDDIEPILFAVIGIDTVTVKGFTVEQLTSMKTMDLGMEILGWPTINESQKNNLESVPVSKQIPIIMNSGAFWSFERQCGVHMKAYFWFNVTASVSFINLNNDYCAAMRTSADDYERWGEIYYKGDYERTKSAGGNVKPSNKVAADTYGMVLDLWVRTNAADSILTLDGLAKYKENQVRRVVQIIVYDEKGNSSTVNKEVWYYTVDREEATDETTPSGEVVTETVTDEYLVYQDQIVDEDDLDQDGDTTETITIYRYTSSRAIAYITEIATNEETGETTETSRLVTSSDVDEKYDIEIVVEGFESSGRVEDEKNKYEGFLQQGEISPLQGSGSCYIFYANNPDEAANTLKMLSYLKLAFVDANNNLLAEAKLNVDFVYADAGKYTVPIVITYSKCQYTAKDGANKDVEYYGITELKQNEATLISVIVYLEGSGVDNSMVLSSETVSGNLNIQFASTQNLDALFNTDLSLKYLSLSAQISGKAADQLTYNGDAQGLPLTATVEGVSGSKVEAIFQRMINATQGSKQDTITLIADKDNPTKYSATAYFTVPGTYVLKTLWIDGSEYELPNQLTVVVDGFAVTSATINGSTTVMTSDNSVTRQVSVAFGSSLQPKTVSARFTYQYIDQYGQPKEEYITEEMSATSNSWSANFTFKNSGTYTLTGLILDNEYYDVPASYQRTLIAYLGMYTEISIIPPTGLEDLEQDEAGNISYLCRGPANMGVQVKIFTKEGQAQEGLQNVVLAYANQNYSDVEDGISANLTWDSAKKCYVGTMPIEEPAFYYHAMVKIAESKEEYARYETLTNARKKPTVTAISPNPPTSSGATNGGMIITGGSSNAQFSAWITDAPSSQNIFAIMADGSEMKVTSYSDGKFDFKFDTNAAGSQSGEYTVTALKFYNVYKDGERYYKDDKKGIDKPYIIDIPDQTYRVMDKLDITANSATVNGSFMEQISLNTKIETVDGKISYTGITVTPKAPETDPSVPGSFKYTDYVKITGMTLELVLNDENTIKTHGGYALPANRTEAQSTTLEDYKKLKVYLTDTNGDGVFEVTSGDKAQLAGEYVFSKLTITVEDDVFGSGVSKTYTYSNTEGNKDLVGYKVTVKTTTPTVTVTTVNPSGSIPTAITDYSSNWFGVTYTLGNNKENKIVTEDGKLKVYAYAKAVEGSDSGGANVGTGDAGFIHPTITFTATGLDSQSTVAIPVGTQSISIKNSESKSITLGSSAFHVRAKDGRFVDYDIQKYTGIGDGVEINQVTITREGIQYTVNLTTPIVIYNPSSINP